MLTTEKTMDFTAVSGFVHTFLTLHRCGARLSTDR
jgi:hypothetical protein